MEYDSVGKCACLPPEKGSVDLIEIFLILVIFNIIIYVTYFIFLRNTTVKDDRNER